MAYRARVLAPWLVGLVVMALSCGGPGPRSPVVGATCTGDRDCANRCVTGDDHYPGGYCTRACNSDNDCPGGTNCVDEHGGICVYNCAIPRDCEGFGRGFTCDGRARRGAPGGDVLVCRVP